MRRAGLPPAVRLSGQRLPHVQAALAQRRLGPVDLASGAPGRRRPAGGPRAARRPRRARPGRRRAARSAGPAWRSARCGSRSGSSWTRSRRRFAVSRSIGSAAGRSAYRRRQPSPPGGPRDQPKRPAVRNRPPWAAGRLTHQLDCMEHALIVSSPAGRVRVAAPPQLRSGPGCGTPRSTPRAHAPPGPAAWWHGRRAVPALRAVLAGQQRRRVRRPARADIGARLPGLARRGRHLAVPDDAVAGPRLGLRRQRLPAASTPSSAPWPTWTS